MEYNYVGKITQTHGLKGEVKVKTDSSFIEERFKPGNTLYFLEKSNYNPIVVKSHRSMLGYELVSFEGLDSIEAITPYIGKELYGEKDRELLDEDEYFYSDYIGMDVSFNGKIVGKVKEICELPQCDYFVIVTEDGKEKLVPLLDEFIEEVDLDSNTLTIVGMEGLL